MDALVERAAARWKGLHAERPLDVQIAPAVRDAWISGDPSLLRRVIDNLLDNAHKYSPAGAPIRVSAELRGGDRVAVAVADHGIGIPPEDLERVFTPFFRSDRSRSRATGGVGLGLALAKRIVGAHGGEITVRSPPGDGTTVSFLVPVCRTVSTSEDPAAT